MNTCAYCGRDNADDATQCQGCGTSEFRGTLALPPTQRKVVKWFKVYAGMLCFTYAAAAAFSLYLIFSEPEERELGAWLIIVALPLFGASFLPLVLKPRPWLWTYDLVLICLGMTSACFLPACIPLLIHWIKPETKAYFGKT